MKKKTLKVMRRMKIGNSVRRRPRGKKRRKNCRRKKKRWMWRAIKKTSWKKKVTNRKKTMTMV